MGENTVKARFKGRVIPASEIEADLAKALGQVKARSDMGQWFWHIPWGETLFTDSELDEALNYGLNMSKVPLNKTYLYRE